MFVKIAVITAGLCLPAVVSAQQTSPEIKPQRQELKADAKDMRSLDRQQAAAMKDLVVREKAAIDAVKADASLAPAQKKEKIAAIAKDYGLQRRDLNAKHHEDRRKLRAAMRKDGQDKR